MGNAEEAVHKGQVMGEQYWTKVEVFDFGIKHHPPNRAEAWVPAGTGESLVAERLGRR